MLSIGFAQSALFAPLLCASTTLLKVAAFTDGLAEIERGVEAGESLGELWQRTQDLYWRAHESRVVRPFFGSYYLPTFINEPDRQGLRYVLDELRSRITPGPINRKDPIAQNTHNWEKRVAVWQGEESLTFGRLDAHADILGRYIAGCRETDEQQVAAFLSRNRREFFAISLGAKRAGVPYTNFHSYLSREQFMEKIQAYPYRVLFMDYETILKLELSLSLLEAMGVIVVDIDNSHPQVLHYRDIIQQFKRPPGAIPDLEAPEYPGPVMMSSGTTGEPKLVRVKSVARMGAEANRIFKITGADRNLVIGQLYHGGALSWAKGHLNRGGQVVLTEESSLALYPERAIELIAEHGITNFWVSPPWLKGLCTYLFDAEGDIRLDSLRSIYVGAAPFHPSLKELAVLVFGPILWENYAITEFGLVTVLRPEELLDHATTVGRAAPGVELQIRDDLGSPVSPGHPGTIYVKNGLTGGRFRAADDLGMLDEEGYLTVLGRSIEKIQTNGVAVFPRIVENHIRELAGIQDCHVIGIPDDKLGERVVAAIVLAPGARLLEDDIINHMADKTRPSLQGLVPNRVVFLRSLPRAPYKIHKPILLEVVKRALERINEGLESP